MTNSFGKTVARLQGLPAACRKHPKLLALVSAEVHELEDNVATLKAGKSRQQSLIAQKQQTTQDLRALLHQTHEIEMRIRHAAQMLFGPRDTRLIEFHVKPLRRGRPRGRSQKKV